MLGTWQGSHWYDSTQKKPCHQHDSNPGSSTLEVNDAVYRCENSCRCLINSQMTLCWLTYQTLMWTTQMYCWCWHIRLWCGLLRCIVDNTFYTPMSLVWFWLVGLVLSVCVCVRAFFGLVSFSLLACVGEESLFLSFLVGYFVLFYSFCLVEGVLLCVWFLGG